MLLEEEVPNTGSETGEVENSNQNYIDAIKDLKANTVSKAEYEKVLAENKKLVQDIVNGQTPEVNQEVIATDKEVEELRKQLFSQECELNNLEYVQKALALRTAIIQKGGLDPFVPFSQSKNPSPENFETAERVAKILQECVDASDGSSEIFTAELSRRMK